MHGHMKEKRKKKKKETLLQEGIFGKIFRFVTFGLKFSFLIFVRFCLRARVKCKKRNSVWVKWWIVRWKRKNGIVWKGKVWRKKGLEWGWKTRHTPIYLSSLGKDCRYLSRSVGSLAFARFLIRNSYALAHINQREDWLDTAHMGLGGGGLWERK